MDAAGDERMGRQSEWTLAGAINIDEGRKLFYTYRELLIVLVGAIPEGAGFLGLTMNSLLTKEGSITPEQFDKIIWLICNATDHFEKTSGQLTDDYTATATAADADVSKLPFISSFSHEATSGGTEVIAKSLTRITIRFLFAMSLNLRGLTVSVPTGPPQALAAVEAGTAVEAVVGDGGEAALTAAYQEAEQMVVDIRRRLSEVTTDNYQEIFKTLKDVLDPMNRGICDMFVSDIENFKKITGPRFRAAGISGISASLRTNLDKHLDTLQKAIDDKTKAANEATELAKLLAQAGNLFSGVKPIPELQCERFGMKSDVLVRELVTKQVMMESSIKKVLDKSVAIQDSPSLQAFLTSIGFIGAKGGGGGAGAAGDGDDDDDGDGEVGRLRSLIESLNASVQCDHAVGALRKIPDVRCYICQGLWVDKSVTMECEHILCIGLAIEYFGLLRSTHLLPEQKEFLSILYAWAHRCCNRLKSNMSFMKINPTYDIRRGNFFMFHDVNAAKLLGKIYDNNKSHDCAVIFNKGKINKQNFIKTRTVGISQKVAPLVTFSNQIFTGWYAASAVLLSAMGCFKNMTSLLISLNNDVHGNRDMLGFNPDRMTLAFKLINPGVLEAAGEGVGMDGGRRRRKHRRTNQTGGTIDDDNIQRILLNREHMTAIEESEVIIANGLEPTEQASPPADPSSLLGGLPQSSQLPAAFGGDMPLGGAPPSTNFILFKLASITNSLNFECLYKQLLIDPDTDEERVIQERLITTFQGICSEYIQHNAPETIDDASLLMLYHITLLSQNDHTLAAVNAFVDSSSRMFPDFFGKCSQVFEGLKTNNLIGRDVNLQQFQHLCLMRPSSLQTCHDNISPIQSATFSMRSEPNTFLAQLILEFDGIIMSTEYYGLSRTIHFDTYCTEMKDISSKIDVGSALRSAVDDDSVFLTQARDLARVAGDNLLRLTCERNGNLDKCAKAKARKDNCDAAVNAATAVLEKANEDMIHILQVRQQIASLMQAAAAKKYPAMLPKLQSIFHGESPLRSPSPSPDSSFGDTLPTQPKYQGFWPPLGLGRGRGRPQSPPPSLPSFSPPPSPARKFPRPDDDMGGGYSTPSTRSRRKHRNHRRTQYTNKHKRASSKTTTRATIKHRKSYRKHKHTVKRRKNRRHH